MMLDWLRHVSRKLDTYSQTLNVNLSQANAVRHKPWFMVLSAISETLSSARSPQNPVNDMFVIHGNVPDCPAVCIQP